MLLISWPQMLLEEGKVRIGKKEGDRFGATVAAIQDIDGDGYNGER